MNEHGSIDLTNTEFMNGHGVINGMPCLSLSNMVKYYILMIRGGGK